MRTQVLVNPSYAGRGHRAEDYLRQQIAFYQTRLDEMGEKGDCAYEHALSRAYEVLLRERKQQLAEL